MKFKTLSLLLSSIVLFGCHNPTANNASTTAAKNLTVSWNLWEAKARTILPSPFPAPATYAITLQPTSGSGINSPSTTDSSYTFYNITPTNYTVTVTGYDSNNQELVTGSGTVDTSTTASSSISITLNYIITGTGTGGISLNVNLPTSGVGSTSDTLTATMTLVDPSGSKTTPTLTKSGSTYTYSNTSAAVGSYQILIKITDTTLSQTAVINDTLLVTENVTTAGNLSLSSSDFAVSAGQLTVKLYCLHNIDMGYDNPKPYIVYYYKEAGLSSTLNTIQTFDATSLELAEGGYLDYTSTGGITSDGGTSTNTYYQTIYNMNNLNGFTGFQIPVYIDSKKNEGVVSDNSSVIYTLTYNSTTDSFTATNPTASSSYYFGADTSTNTTPTKLDSTWTLTRGGGEKIVSLVATASSKHVLTKVGFIWN